MVTNQPMLVAPSEVRVGDMLNDPSFPDQHEWVEVKRAYRSDHREGVRAFEVQDSRGNEYEVYASLSTKLLINRDREVTT